MKACTQYKAIIEVSRAVGWPKDYRDDLEKHDYTALRTERPDRFVWILRESGTHLYIPHAGTGMGSVESMIAINRAYRQKHVYLYENGKLSRVDNMFHAVDAFQAWTKAINKHNSVSLRLDTSRITASDCLVVQSIAHPQYGCRHCGKKRRKVSQIAIYPSARVALPYFNDTPGPPSRVLVPDICKTCLKKIIAEAHLAIGYWAKG